MAEKGFEIKNDTIEGRNAVIEALRAGRAIDKIFIAKGDVDKTLGHIASRAREKGIVVVEADRRKLDFMSQTHAHQGVIALAAIREYCEINDILTRASERQEPPFVIVCDEISDPHNLGAIIRSAECAGAHGIVIPKRRSAGLTAVVDKASAGAAEHMLIARVPNISSALKELKEQGLWVYGTAGRRTERPLAHRLHRSHGPGNRLRGGRYGPSGKRKLRLCGKSAYEGAGQLPQRRRCRRHYHV